MYASSSATHSSWSSRSTTPRSTLASGEEYWELFSTSYGPTKTAIEALETERREEFHQAWVEFFGDARREGDAMVHHREYLLTLGTRKLVGLRSASNVSPDARLRHDGQDRLARAQARVRVPVLGDLRRARVVVRLRPLRRAAEGERQGALAGGDGARAGRHRRARLLDHPAPRGVGGVGARDRASRIPSSTAGSASGATGPTSSTRPSAGLVPASIPARPTSATSRSRGSST